MPTPPTSPTLVARTLAGLAVVLTGLSAGFFYTYADSVTRGLALTTDATYVEAFQNINDVVRTPLFVVVFAGPAVALAAAAVAGRKHRWSAALLGAAGLVYVGGVVLVTMTGNVPLNEALATKTDLDAAGYAAARTAFETRWNDLNLARTIAAVVAFGLAAAALVVGPADRARPSGA